MQAIQGIYDNGIIKLDKKAPVNKTRVIVLFTDEYVKDKISVEEALSILHKHTGSIKSDINFESERAEYLHEKYGPVN
ncbi:MAG: hypothetical protein LBR83_01105 [Clostridiales bacterium]|jgi:hypothetical protein|nr:hypothetical protein [Clostridiales bacterium]